MAEQHDTLKECRFITWLGLGPKEERYTACSRLDLLTNYHAALQRRVNWDGIDRVVVMRHITQEIEREQKLLQARG